MVFMDRIARNANVNSVNGEEASSANIKLRNGRSKHLSVSKSFRKEIPTREIVFGTVGDSW